MNYRPAMCRSETKIPNPVRWNSGSRNSLQNENCSFRSRRSSSVEGRGRVSGSIPRPRCSSEERKSTLFGSRTSGRKSSININELRNVKDTRPLTDKAYQRKKLTELVEYLTSHDFKHPVSVNKLMQGSRKDFENIFQHLMFVYDSQYVVKRIDEEAPKMLKNLLYPFIPTKSSFICVTRTNWPSLLGVLFFLMDMVKFSESFSQQIFFSSAEAERPKEHALLLNYIFTCYFSNDDNEEEEAKVFTKMIRARGNYDLEGLQQENERLESELSVLKHEMDVINELKARSAQDDTDIVQYEEYLLKMREHKKRKEGICQKLSDELTSKESELQGLREVIEKKQASYDAQGFDGKKQMSYFESQKKDLLEKLQTRKATFKDLQNQCWDLELQHSQDIEKGNTLCDNFNKLYSNLSEMASTVLEPLNPVTDPTVKNVCTSFKLEFPDYKLQPTQACLVQKSNARKVSLEELKKKMESPNLIFKGLASRQNQKLTEILCEIDEASLHLKLKNSQEAQKERDLNMMDKQALAEAKEMETKVDEMLKSLEQLQAERSKEEEGNDELKDELKEIIELKKSKQKMSDEYILEQNKLFERYAKAIEKAENNIEKAGKNILSSLKRHLT